MWEKPAIKMEGKKRPLIAALYKCRSLVDSRITLHTSREGQISPVGASAIIGNMSLGMSGREVFIKLEKNDLE